MSGNSTTDSDSLGAGSVTPPELHRVTGLERAATVTPGQAPLDAEADTGDMHSDLLELAWGLIANAGWDAHSGNTALDKSPGWHDAAIRWRDDYHRWLRLHCTPSGWRTWEELAGSLTSERNALIAENAELRRRKPGSERVAELVTEGNELRKQLAVILDWYTPIGDANSHRATVSTTQLAQWRRQAGISTPAVVTAGTEHLVPLIRDLTIPDEEG